jgi:hypothetical protein
MAPDDPSGGRPAAPIVLRIKLRYDDLEAMVQRFAANVGKSGLFLPTRSMQPIGAEVKFELRLADDTPALVGLGRVKAVKPPDPHNPKAAFGMAIELMRVTPQSRALILRMLERRRALGLPEVGLPTAADIDAVRRGEPGDAGRDLGTGPVVLVAPPMPAPPVPAVAAGPVPVVGEGLLTAPRRTTGPISVAKVAAIAPLPPEPPRRPRAPVSEVLERASGPIVGLAAAVPGPDDDVDLAAAIARARALAGGALDAELEALCEAAAAPLEISVEVASAELARQLGGSAVRRDRSAGWAPPPATSLESPDAARSNGAALNGAARAPAIDDAALVAAAERLGQDAAPAADERAADDAAPVLAAERPGQDAAPAAADDAAPVVAAERPGQDAAPAAADDAAPVVAAERPGQDAAPAATDDVAPVAAGPEDGAASGAAAAPEAVAEWSAAAETESAPAASAVAGVETAAPSAAAVEVDASSGAAEMAGDAAFADAPADPDPAPGLAAIEAPDAPRPTDAFDAPDDDDDRGAPAWPYDLPRLERIRTEPSAPVGVVFPAEGRAELALADLDSDEHTELGEMPVAPGGFEPPVDPGDHAAAEAEIAAGFAPAAEPPLELGVDEFDDFEIIAEANADDEDLLASHGEHDASSRRELAARPETGERRPSELDFAARLDLGDDGDLYLGASADELSAGQVLDSLQDEQTRQHPAHRERFAPAPPDPRAISVGVALAALEADDEVGDEDGDDAFDDAEVTEDPDAYAQRVVRPIFDPDPSSSVTLAGVPSDSIDVDIPAPRRPGPSEPPRPAHRAEPIAPPRPARRHAPLSLHEAPVEDHELEHALEALDVDLDDLAIPHAAPQRQREPSRPTPQVRSQPASRTPAPGVRGAQPTPAPPRGAQPTPAPPRAAQPTPAPPRVAASTPSRAVLPTGLGAPGSRRIGSPRVPSEGVDIEFDDDD